MTHRLVSAVLALAMVSGLSGCKGSVKAEAKASGTSSSDVDFDASQKRDEAWESEALPSSGGAAPASSARSASAPAPASTTLLGARHDLTLAGKPSPTCQCLAVVAGDPKHAGLAWSGPAPAIDPKTQLVVALSSDRVDCSIEAPRASYMGYEVREADVVIQVEGAALGRPLTQGAIVPRPMSGGKLLIESTSKLPYGKALGGQGPCTVPF